MTRLEDRTPKGSTSRAGEVRSPIESAGGTSTRRAGAWDELAHDNFSIAIRDTIDRDQS